MASNSVNPHLEREDGSLEEDFPIGDDESDVLAVAFGQPVTQG